jgi:hypothetical protein
MVPHAIRDPADAHAVTEHSECYSAASTLACMPVQESSHNKLDLAMHWIRCVSNGTFDVKLYQALSSMTGERCSTVWPTHVVNRSGPAPVDHDLQMSRR